MPSEELRARYRAMKKGRSASTKAKAKGRAKGIANADTRTRQILEREMAGETLDEIANSLGRKRDSVELSIDLYRKRHPDCPIPVGRQDRNEESEA